MTFANDMAERLDARPAVNGAVVVGWRFDLSESRAIRAGLKDSHLGGPYNAPAVANGLGGGIYLVWSDSLISHGNVDVFAVRDFSERLISWRESAFRDPHAPPLLAPADYPRVDTHDAGVARVLDGDTGVIFDLLRRGLDTCRGQRATIVDAGVGAAQGVRFLYSSTGIRVSYPETSFSFWCSADDLYSNGYGKRRLPAEDEIAYVFNDVATTAAALRSDGRGVSGDLPVVLPPNEASAFLDQFLGANLSGSAVVNGQAAFTLDDFKSGRHVVREDLQVWVDSLLPLEGAASPVSGEGVPGGRADLVRDGRLVTPVLDLKYSSKAGMSPTPLPRGGPGMLVRSIRDGMPPAALLEGIDRGLYVYSVLGMHTQDSSSGKYSLVAPQARAIVHGELRDGRVKAVLAGNFLDHLRDDRTRFATYPYAWAPGMRIQCQVTVEH